VAEAGVFHLGAGHGHEDRGIAVGLVIGIGELLALVHPVEDEKAPGAAGFGPEHHRGLGFEIGDELQILLVRILGVLGLLVAEQLLAGRKHGGLGRGRGIGAEDRLPGRIVGPKDHRAIAFGHRHQHPAILGQGGQPLGQTVVCDIFDGGHYQSLSLMLSSSALNCKSGGIALGSTPAW